MNFYISDTHFGHNNVIRFDNRPFRSISEMESIIVSNWNSTVKDTDTVYILGDFIWSKDENTWMDICDELAGKKVLILGNHDKKEFSKQLRSRFENITNLLEITDSMKHVVMCHYPIPFYRSDYSPDIYMLYGHVHNTKEAKYIKDFIATIKERRTGEKGEPLGQCYHVGCMEPYMNYTPRTLKEIISANEPERC